jgi:hypothetical protein
VSTTTAAFLDPPPRTLGGIRAALPERDRPAFDLQRDNLDLADLPAVARFLDTWQSTASRHRARTIQEGGPSMRGFLIDEDTHEEP